MWIKICGNTNVEDALEAATLGADALGFVLAPSVRRVSAQLVREIGAKLPAGVERVGVFTEGTVEEIAATAEEAGLTAVQMHAEFDPAFARRLRERLGPGIAVIQAMHWVVGVDAHADKASELKIRGQLAAVAAAGGMERVLVDAKVGAASGGLGVSFDWAKARDVLRTQSAVRVVVAGGLTPGNVAEAIGAMAPWGVDVASGVEREPGRKDQGKLRDFIMNARRA